MSTLSKRQLQIARILQENLHNIFARENLLCNHGLLCSIQSVVITENLREAKVFLSIYPVNKIEEFWQYFTQVEMQVQRSINQKLQYQFSRIPKLSFHTDKSCEKADKMYQILNNL